MEQQINIHSHFGVYALIAEDRKLLVIKKARGPYTGKYDLPGGTPEPLELLEETVTREVKEETGCNITSAAQMGGFSALYNYTHATKGPSTFRHLGVIYRCEISGTPMAHGDDQDSEGSVFMPYHELNAQNATPFVLQAMEKAGLLTK